MSGQRRRRWPDIIPTLVQRVVRVMTQLRVNPTLGFSYSSANQCNELFSWLPVSDAFDSMLAGQLSRTQLSSADKKWYIRHASKDALGVHLILL